MGRQLADTADTLDGIGVIVWCLAALYIMGWSLHRTVRRERDLRRHRHKRAVARLEFDLEMFLAEDPFYRWPEDPQFR